jgi:hypothetical protein
MMSRHLLRWGLCMTAAVALSMLVPTTPYAPAIWFGIGAAAGAVYALWMEGRP